MLPIRECEASNCQTRDTRQCRDWDADVGDYEKWAQMEDMAG